MTQEITHKSFESIIGESVDIEAGEAAFQAEIEDVSLLHRQPGQERQPFSVVLQARDGINHGQQMYQLNHPDLGDLSLFLVPLGPGEGGMRYEAIFN